MDMTMIGTMIGNGSFVQIVSSVLWEAQTEIAVFVIALCAHVLFFRRQLGKSSEPDLKKGISAEAGSIINPNAAASRAPERILRSRPKTESLTLARDLEPLLISGATVEVLTKEISSQLSACPDDNVTSTLAGMLETFGKAAVNIELLAAVRSELRARSLRCDERLADILLRGYLHYRLMDEFDDILADCETSQPAGPSLGLLALRAALQRNDFKAAMARFEGLRILWQVASPSVLAQLVLQQLVRLAAQNEALPKFFEDLRTLKLTTETLNVVITECAKVNDFSSMQAAEQLGRAQGIPFNSATFFALLKGVQTSADVVRLLAEASEAGAVTKVILQVAAEYIAQRGGVEHSAGNRVKDVMNAFKLCPGKSTCLYNSLLDVCITSGDLQTAEQIVMDASKDGVADVETYTAIIGAYLQCGSLKQAKETMKKVRGTGMELTGAMFNKLVDSAIKYNFDGAWWVVSEMNTYGIKPDNVTCLIFLKCVQPNTIIYDVQRTLRMVEKLDCDMDEFMLSRVVEVCVRVQRRDLLMPHLEKQRTANRVEVNHPQTYGSLIRAYSFAEDVNAMWEHWTEMRTRRIMPTSITVGVMVEAVVANMGPDAGYKLLREMQDDNDTRRIMNAVIYCSVIKGFSHKNQFDRVWSLYEEMLAAQIVMVASTYNALIDACARCGEMSRASMLLEEMVRTGVQPDLITYCTILKGFSHQKRFDRVWAVYDEMVREKIAFSVVTYTVLFDACAQSGDMDRAPALLKEMPTKGIEPNLVTYSTILKGYCMANRMEDAFDLMTSMTQKTKMLPDKIMYNHLFEGCARQGLFARGMNLLAQMREARVQPDNFTLSVLVKLIGRKGKLHQAFDLCAELSTLHHVQLNIYVYNNLVHACVVHHDFPRAISVIKEMVSANIWPDARTYTPLLRAFIAARDLQGAMNLLNTVTGQPGGLPSLSDVDASALTPKDGLPIAIVSEVLSGIACHNAELASKMAQNLKCLEPYKQLDTKPRPGHRGSRYSHRS